MRLFLVWLIGVPLLVVCMVLGQSLASASQRVANQEAARSTSCRQRNLNDMALVVAQQRDNVSCKQLSVN
jgi:hypothetical protein